MDWCWGFNWDSLLRSVATARIVVLNAQPNLADNNSGREQPWAASSSHKKEVWNVCLCMSFACSLALWMRRFLKYVLLKMMNVSCVVCVCAVRVYTVARERRHIQILIEKKNAAAARNGCIKCFERARAQHTSSAWANYQQRTMHICVDCWPNGWLLLPLKCWAYFVMSAFDKDFATAQWLCALWPVDACTLVARKWTQCTITPNSEKNM